VTITVSVSLGYEFDVKASAKEVFALLSDIPASASHYPGVAQLTDLGASTYRWEMEKIGVASIQLQTVYASKYRSNKTKGTVSWTPVADEGNALVSGGWQITDNKKSTHLVLNVEAEVSLPLPALMELVASPVVEAELERLTEQYIANLCEQLGGEV
jgi:carbon monoxide dehydrogenase subunit G